MPPRRNKEKSQQLTEFEQSGDYRPWTRSIFLSRNKRSCAAKQFHSDVSLEATDRRAPTNSKNWQQLAARWSTAAGVIISASSIRRRLLHRGLTKIRHTHVTAQLVPLSSGLGEKDRP
ncbi:hypothetical protein TNCV_1303461 [Trichonephila clavipes]|nr:hypothetical protein TNCV_1303461 [Trichonephila clavipes]